MSKLENKENHQPTEGDILLAFPLFKYDETYDIHEVIKHLKNFWELEIDEEEVKQDAAVFHINGQMVAIAEMASPIPGDDLENIAPYNYQWRTALQDIEGYKRHAIVSVLSGEQSAFDRFMLMSKMICSIMMNSDCLGVYFSSSDLLLQREMYLDFVDDIKKNEVPLPLWIYIGIRPGTENKMNLYTYGLRYFGKRELEIIDSKMSMEELYNFMNNIAIYVIEQDVTLRDGETIGYSATHKVKIKESEGVYIEDKTLKLIL